MKSVCILGLGYIGLPTASILAAAGYEVCGVDIREEVVQALNKGDVLIREPFLAEQVRREVCASRLRASREPFFADVFIISVPTPIREDKTPDVSYVRTAIQSITPYLRPGCLVLLESTCPVGTTEQLCEWMAEARPDLVLPGGKPGDKESVYVACCPERVLPGRILRELLENDRIIGGVDDASTTKAESFYRSFVRGGVLRTRAREAELVKLAENSYRDVNVAFANELSMICHTMGCDVWEIIRLANCHPRVNILSPGAGVGGHCIAVDPWFLITGALREARLLQAARQVNDSKPLWVIDRIQRAAEYLENPVIACMGITFKPDVDDLRGSPALRIVETLSRATSCSLLIAEPNISDLPPSLSMKERVCLCPGDEAVARADLVVFLVRHSPFLVFTMDDLKEKRVIDVCGALVDQSAKHCS